MRRSAKISAVCVAVFSSLYYFCGLTAFMAFFVSILIHELGHVTVLLIFGGRIKNISLEAGGFKIDGAGVVSQTGEILALLAGPIYGIGLSVICLTVSVPEWKLFLDNVAIISFALSVYNLLPALPIDGGRIIERLLTVKISERKTSKILEISGIVSGIATALLGAYFSQIILVGGGMWLLIAQTGIVKNR